MNTCRSCGAEILWVQMPTGLLAPVDKEPVPTGNIVLTWPTKPRQAIRASVVAGPSLLDESRYLSHFATCPRGKKWRKK